MKRKFRLNDIVSKLTREEMKCICGGSGMGGFPSAQCIVECKDGTIIGSTCPPPSFVCGDVGIRSWKPNN